MPTEGTYYLLFEKHNFDTMTFNPVTFNINGTSLTVQWKYNDDFKCFYYEENLYSNEAIRKHTRKLVKNLEEIYQRKIKYILTKDVVLELADPDAGGFIN